jgi:hypothetical protein
MDSNAKREGFDMGMNTITNPCPRCEKPVSYQPCPLLPGIVPLCDECAERQETEFETNQRRERWLTMLAENMPEDYRNAVPSKIISELKPVTGWNRQKYPNGMGVIAPTNSGKSCAVACLIAMLKHPFRWWSGAEARQISIEAAKSDPTSTPARLWHSAMHRVPVLVIDDIAQAKFTESWASALFELLESRTKKHLPTFWTMQITGSELRQKIADQNGGDYAQAKAIITRLTNGMEHVKAMNAIRASFP